MSSDLIQRIQQTVEGEPGLSRGALSRRICRWLDWRTARGQLKEVSCRVALLKLQRRGWLALPRAGHAAVPRPGPLG
ncbi:MAG: hypothetical protein ABSA59_11035, partial [Terriglobia bacterium]